MSYIIESRGSRMLLGDRPVVMGIINCTPDSFSDGGQFPTPEAAAERAVQMVDEGADIIDIGGESSRPGAQPVSEEEELSRVIPVIELLRNECSAWMSIDTYRSTVAREALRAGVRMINDISGLRFDSQMAGVACDFDVPVVVMHMKGEPRNMQANPVYDDVVAEITGFFKERIRALGDAGIDKDKIIIDPGIGFGKTVEHNLHILNNLDRFNVLERPILIGVSRKSFIGKILDLPANDRLEGTAAAVAFSLIRGAHIVRVHDVKEMNRVARIINAIINCEA